MMNDEPIDIALGLPGPLPAGERVLWHGKPERAALLRYLFRWPLLVAYFALFALLPILATAQSGASVAQVLFSPVLLLPFALPVAGLVMASAWALARTSVYVITDRRVILQVGVAFTRTVNIPLELIADVSARERPHGMDIALTLRSADKIAWLALWPHVRGAQFSHPVPMLRGLPVDSPAGSILVDAIMRTAPGVRHIPARVEKAQDGIDVATERAPQHV
ncbi:MAG: phosphopantetheine adenylyltransferase [Citromicrobium sp.]|nr:phosphopantetheine adenylyltransferase [Citromicrobium sp.]MAS85985.1 phosphopantetheine adenylyltransferase [Erythrobacteraceae bacterium]MAO94899.1 phosphopantetheine adenylyltransferase [Citromicrobium sp.]MAO96692.1 phosphopantetheine adenylyltransferase [Citromicrobium sp.]MBD77038.1 phosphopantetheine adenylyltransferase [Citromicrobium sp.]|tara:strand:+ start:7973 stop:8635 length:663 start_codon:yes stop_codon:yes gene_type:complete